MPRMSYVASVAAGATTTNIFAGQLEELLRGPGEVSLFGTGGGAGMHLTFMVGGRAIVDDMEISALTTFPKIPDDFIASEAGLQGDRVFAKLRNSTAGALVASIVADVEYV